MTKICSKCKKELPATNYYFHRAKNRPDGLYEQCKKCRGYPYGETRRRENLTYNNEEDSNGYKRCHKCNRLLPATYDYFHKDKKCLAGLYNVCRECRGYKFGDIQRQENLGLCKANECNKKSVKSGYCENHYRKFRKYGDPLYNGRLPGNIKKDQICSNCKNVFHSVYISKYCSRECMGITFRKQELKKCKLCNAEFLPKGENNVYCSKECRNAKKKLVCEYCKKEFYSKHESTKYCSRICASKSWFEINTFARRSYQRKRTEKKKGLNADNIDYLEIFNRDKWICQLCNKKVNKDLKHPHPMSATIDHIIPLSKGGTHETKNVQLAHYLCNMKKGNRTTEYGEQLRLC